MSAVPKGSPLPANDAAHDAITMLVGDHKHVKSLFAQFAKLKDEKASNASRRAVVKQVCDALKVHSQIEEEIFYPAVRKAIRDPDLMDEALVEHAGAKALIEQLEEMDPADALYDAKVTVLREQIEHHVNEEEGEMFPHAKSAKVDTLGLGAKMLKRREELTSKRKIQPSEGTKRGQS